MRMHEKIAIGLGILFVGVAGMESVTAERPQDDSNRPVQQDTQVRTHRAPQTPTEAPKPPAPVEPECINCIDYPIDGPYIHKNPSTTYKVIQEGVSGKTAQESIEEMVTNAVEDAVQQAEDGE